MRKADGKCRRAIMSPVSHLWTCTLDDGERVWDTKNDEAKPSFDEAKRILITACSQFSFIEEC